MTSSLDEAEFFRITAALMNESMNLMEEVAAAIKLEEAELALFRTLEARVLEILRENPAEEPEINREHTRRNSAAVTLQSAVRRALWRKKYSVVSACLLCIQAWARRVLTRRNFLQQKSAAVRIQRATKRRFLAHGTKEGVAGVFPDGKNRAVSGITQSSDRAVEQECTERGLSSAVVKVQKIWRSYIYGKLSEDAAVTIQAAVRRLAVMRRLAPKHAAANALQCVWRQKCAREMYLSLFLIKTEGSAAILLQRIWRGKLARAEQSYEALCATLIQASFRTMMETKRYQVMKRENYVLLGAANGIVARLQAAIKLQRFWRASSLRQHQSGAAVTIQAGIRRLNAMKQWGSERAAANTVQRFLREKCLRASRSQQEVMLASAVSIQCAWRKFSAQLYAVSSLICSWRVNRKSPRDAVISRFEWLKGGVHILRDAAKGNASVRHITYFTAEEDDIYLQWTRHVDVAVRSRDTEENIKIQCRFVVECKLEKALFLNSFSTQKLKLIALKATLRSLLKQEEDTIRQIAASTIKSLLECMLKEKNIPES